MSFENQAMFYIKLMTLLMEDLDRELRKEFNLTEPEIPGPVVPTEEGEDG
jgi:hypothetical protein